MARAIQTIQRARLAAGPTVREDAKDQRFSFTSRCPKCQREGVTQTYARGELPRLLELGYPIEAHCTECDLQWPLGPEARLEIAQVARWILAILCSFPKRDCQSFANRAKKREGRLGEQG